MTTKISFIGPDVFMNHKGQAMVKTASNDYVPVVNKYVEAEERYVQKHLQAKGRDS